MCWEICQVEKKTSFHSCFEAHSMVYDYKTNPHLISRTCAVPSPTLVKKYFLRNSRNSLRINPSLRQFLARSFRFTLKHLNVTKTKSGIFLACIEIDSNSVGVLITVPFLFAKFE